MKCPKCGSNLTIDHEKCPFCGNDNPFAVKHRREMSRFKKDYNKTKADVMQTSKKVNAWAVKTTLIAVLVALNVVLMLVNENVYSIHDFFNARKIEANYLVHKAKLDEMEANRQYIPLAEYWDRYELSDSEILDEYYAVRWVCSNYSIVYQYAMQLVNEEDYYASEESQLETLADYIEHVYQRAKPVEYHMETRYKPVHQECIDDLVKQMEDLLQVYFHLTDEEVESLSNLDDARLRILLEEGLARNEQNEL